jgi:LmbE family N-acetylglucosaminyl deacetylase
VTEPTSNSARLAARPIDEGGTPVEVWTQWQRDFPVLNVDDCPALVLVAAHPDDETLGLGATAAILSRGSVVVQLVVVTDGEAAYPDDSGGRRELAKLRRDELAAAAEALGLPTPIFLRIPDGEVQRHERRLSARLSMMLAGFDRGTWCAATWRGDGHPDHEATGRAAAAAAKRAGARFLEYPIWMWHWATPDDPAVPWHRAWRVELTPGDLATKAEAMRCFASQLERGDGPPLLTAEVVERQMAVGEIVFV